MGDWRLACRGTGDRGSYVLSLALGLFQAALRWSEGRHVEQPHKYYCFQLNSCDLVPQLYSDQPAKFPPHYIVGWSPQSWRVASHMPACGIWTCRSCVAHSRWFKTRAEDHLNYWFPSCSPHWEVGGVLLTTDRMLLLPCLAWTVPMVTRPQDGSVYDRWGSWGCQGCG